VCSSLYKALHREKVVGDPIPLDHTPAHDGLKRLCLKFEVDYKEPPNTVREFIGYLKEVHNLVNLSMWISGCSTSAVADQEISGSDDESESSTPASSSSSASPSDMSELEDE
jgi:hypothetical protein